MITHPKYVVNNTKVARLSQFYAIYFCTLHLKHQKTSPTIPAKRIKVNSASFLDWVTTEPAYSIGSYLRNWYSIKPVVVQYGFVLNLCVKDYFDSKISLKKFSSNFFFVLHFLTFRYAFIGVFIESNLFP